MTLGLLYLFIAAIVLLPMQTLAGPKNLPTIHPSVEPIWNLMHQISAQELLRVCTGSDADKDTCAVFIDGVLAGATGERLFLGFSLVKSKTEPPKVLVPLLTHDLYCPPDGFSNQDAVKAVVTFIKKLPSRDTRKYRAGFVILLALNNQYPCTLSELLQSYN